MKTFGRFLLSAGTGVLILTAGLFVAFVLGVLTLPDGPPGGGNPGDGLLIMGFLALGLLFSVPLAFAIGSWIFDRPREGTEGRHCAISRHVALRRHIIGACLPEE